MEDNLLGNNWFPDPWQLSKTDHFIEIQPQQQNEPN